MSTESAFQDAAWFEREAAALRRLARALVAGDAELDDLLQESWLAARRLPEPPREPRAWMRRVLARLAIRRAARADARTARERAAARPEAIDGPDASLEHAELLQRVLAELAALAPAERRVLHALYLEGRTPRDAAAALGMNENTLRSHARRGLASLRERLDRQRPRDEWLRGLALGLGLERGASATSATSATASAAAPASVGAGSAAGVAIGGGVMAVSMKWVGAAAILIAALAWWGLRRPVEPTPSAASLAPAASEAVLAAPEPPPPPHSERAEVAELVAALEPGAAAVAPPKATAVEQIVRGIVVDWLDRPVPSAEILDASEFEGYTATRTVALTDAAGRFEFVRGRTWQVYASAERFAPSLSTTLGARTLEFELRLVLPAEGGSVEGRVIACSGAAVAGALVRVGEAKPAVSRTADGARAQVPAGRCVATDDAGRFRIAGLPRGRAEVHARSRGCAPSVRGIEIGAEPCEVELQLEPQARVRGTVTEADGKRVSTALLRLFGDRTEPERRTFSNSDGEFEFRDLPSASVRVEVARSGYPEKLSQEFQLEAGSVAVWNPVLPPRSTRVFRGRLVGGGVLDFSTWTIDAATGASDGVLGVSVSADGSFAIDPRGHASAKLAVFAPGNAERRYPVVVLASVPLEGPLLEIPIPEHWAAVGSFRARLLFASGEPARPSSILLLPLMGGGYLSRSVMQLSVDPATAIVSEAGLPPGDYRLLVDSGGSFVLESVAEFTLQPSQAVDLGDLLVPGPGWLRAELRFDGAPFEGPFERIVIQRASPSGAWYPLATFRDRMPEQVKLPVGEYRFEFHARGRVPSAEFAFRIDSERTTQLDVDLRSKREQRVRVLPKTGAVPPDALTLRSRLVRLGDDAVERPWTELVFARVGDAWERVLSVEVGAYELEVDAGAAGRAKLEHDCQGVLPDVLTIQLE